MTLVKLLLLIITFFMTFILSVESVEYDKETKKELEIMGVYFGDPLENKIIGQGDMYVVIHNPTALALAVMGQEAVDYCRQIIGDNFTSSFIKILGRHTAYFSCNEKNKIDPWSKTKRSSLKGYTSLFHLASTVFLNRLS